MGEPRQRRLPLVWLEEILEAFRQQALSEAQACEMLRLTRARLSRVKRHDLQARWQGGR